MRPPLPTLVLAARTLVGFAFAAGAPAAAQPEGADGRLDVLVVTAHPDDETLMAATLYKLARELGANVDLALVTDGSGGFDFALMGERYYGREIDTEPEARDNLPPIRRNELLGAGRVLGLRNVFFIDEYDHRYTTDVDTVLQHVWDVEDVLDRLGEILRRVPYDFVLGLLPVAGTHGHHKGATILALEAVAALPAARRPLVLGADFAEHAALPAPGAPPYAFTGLVGYPITRVDPAAPVLRFDRTQPMEGDHVATYQLVVNWALAEHKSQGDLASYYDDVGSEYFWFFAANDPARISDAEALFARLNDNPYVPSP